MSIVTQTRLFNLCITYFDGKEQLVPWAGYDVEGMVPYVPEDNGPGWVCFILEYQQGEDFRNLSSRLAGMLFLDLGFTAEQVMRLMEDF